jgi:hypothetical protein
MFHAQEKKAVGGTGFKDEPDVYITDPDFKGAVVQSWPQEKYTCDE